jgi:hypothetical protein
MPLLGAEDEAIEDTQAWLEEVNAAVAALRPLTGGPLGWGWGGGVVNALHGVIEAASPEQAVRQMVDLYRQQLPEKFGTRATELTGAEVATEATGASEAERRQFEQIGRVVVWAHHVLRHLDALDALFGHSWDRDHWQWPAEHSLDTAAETHALFIALNQLGDHHKGAPGAMRVAYPLPADLPRTGDTLRNVSEHPNGGKEKTRQAVEDLGLTPGVLSWSARDGLLLAGRLHLRDTRAAVQTVYDGFVLEGRRILGLLRGDLVARFEADGSGGLRRVG